MTSKKTPRPLPDQSVLLDLLSYCAETGIVKWRDRTDRFFPYGKRGAYLGIHIDGKNYMLHRIVWKMMTGSDPEHYIDHVDGDKRNNRWSNIRQATVSQNSQNRRVNPRSASGIKGVNWDKKSQKWIIKVGLNGKQHELGRFTSVREAAKAVAIERARLHGEYACAD